MYTKEENKVIYLNTGLNRLFFLVKNLGKEIDVGLYFFPHSFWHSS